MESQNDRILYITASMLYDFLKCEHRVWRDIYGPQDERIQEINPFVQLLWDKGIQHEKEIVAKLGDFVDLSQGTLQSRFKETMAAMKKGTPLIYQGVLINDKLLGIPDLLQYQEDCQYIPIDIKSGMGYEGADDDSDEMGKPKKTYAVQLALYVELLQFLGFTNKKRGLIIDINSKNIQYELDKPVGIRDKRSFWQLYLEVKENVIALVKNSVSNTPAFGGVCKLCSWYNSCMKWVEETDDLTGLFYMGRSKRNIILSDIGIGKIQDSLSLDVDMIMEKKKADKAFLKGIGQKTLEKIIARANVVKNINAPVIYSKIDFPAVSYELFFDIEDDPTQDFIYLHGIYERSAQAGKYIGFVAKQVDSMAEKLAWSDFWEYIGTLPVDDYAVYYYSSHEKTTYRELQKKYPDVITSESLDSFFDKPNVIDLYSIVFSNSDWPLSSYSLKSIAMYLGFEWRDDSPSGALSIQWFNKFLSTHDENILNRILAYNEDDCKATMILKDKLKEWSDNIS